MISFRPATQDDAEAIAQLHANSWQQNYRGAMTDNFLDNEAAVDRQHVWKKRLQDSSPDQFVAVAEYGKKIVGFVCLYFDHSEEYGTLLDNLHVSSAAQDKGVGRRLMRLATEEIELQRPGSAMYLWVLEQNSGAIRFYETLGGQKMETVEELDIGDIPVIKSRYYWKFLVPLLEL